MIQSTTFGHLHKLGDIAVQVDATVASVTDKHTFLERDVNYSNSAQKTEKFDSLMHVININLVPRVVTVRT